MSDDDVPGDGKKKIGASSSSFSDAAGASGTAAVDELGQLHRWTENRDARREADRAVLSNANGSTLTHCILCFDDGTANSHITSKFVLRRVAQAMENAKVGDFAVLMKRKEMSLVLTNREGSGCVYGLLCQRCDNSLGAKIEGPFASQSPAIDWKAPVSYLFAVLHSFRVITLRLLKTVVRIQCLHVRSNVPQATSGLFWSLFDDLRHVLLCVVNGQALQTSVRYWWTDLPYRVRLGCCRIGLSAANNLASAQVPNLLRDFCFIVDHAVVLKAKHTPEPVVCVWFFGVALCLTIFSMSLATVVWFPGTTPCCG